MACWGPSFPAHWRQLLVRVIHRAPVEASGMQETRQQMGRVKLKEQDQRGWEEGLMGWDHLVLCMVCDHGSLLMCIKQ